MSLKEYYVSKVPIFTRLNSYKHIVSRLKLSTELLPDQDSSELIIRKNILKLYTKGVSIF